MMSYSVMFHHFCDNNLYPKFEGGGGLSSSDFHLIIDYLEENFNLLTPYQYMQKVEYGNIQKSDVCLTFDDALKCQFDIMYPELEKRKLKAFFFVYSGAYSENPAPLEFFRDFRFNFFGDVDHYYDTFFNIVKHQHVNHYQLFLDKYQSNYLSKFSFYTENDKKYRFLRDVILKDQYFDIVFEMMKEKKYSILDRRKDLFMSIDNLKIIHNDGHVLGLHSDTHPTGINNFSYDRQLKEYTKNYDFINSITKEKIHAVAHPCGNYNSDTLKILRKLGIKIGFRSSLNPSNIESSLEIPRENYANIISKIKV